MKKVGSDTRKGVSYSGMDSLSMANERMQQSLNFEQQSAGQRAQMGQNTLQAISKSSANIAAAEVNKIASLEAADQREIAQKAQPGGNTIGQIAGAIGNAASTYMNIKAKDRELDVAEYQINAKREADAAEQAARQAAEERKIALAENFVKVNDALKTFMLSSQKDGMLTMETGLTEFRTKGLRIIDGADISPEDRVTLANELYATIRTTNDKGILKQEELVEDIKSKTTDTLLSQIQIEMAGTLAAAKSDRPEVREAALKDAKVMLYNLVEKSDLGQLEKLEVYRVVTEGIAKNYTEGTQAHADARALWNNYSKFQYEVAIADEKYHNGEFTIAERQVYLEKKAIENRLPKSAAGDYDPNAESKDALEAAKRVKEIQQLQEEQVVDAGAAFTYTNEEIGVMALEMLNNPTIENVYLSNPETRENPYVKRAIETKNIFLKVQKENGDLNMDIQSTLAEITKIQQSGVKWLISQDQSARTPSMQAVIESALEGIPLPTGANAAALTPEEMAAAEAALQQVVGALQGKAALMQEKMTNNIEQLSPYGLSSLDQSTLAKTLPDRKASLDKRLETWRQNRQAISDSQPAGIGIASPTRAGGRPTFGGVKALATYNAPEGKVVLPIRAGTKGWNIEAIPGQKFGADRPRGKGAHAGEDIGLPVGTEVVAYVGMTLIRATPTSRSNGGGYALTFKGDDGKFHKFLHLTENSSYYKPGQRVEAGQPFAKSGDTGNGVPHLHFEIRTNDSSGRDGALDPLKYLASMNGKSSMVQKPVGNTKNLNYEPGVQQVRIPKGARPFGNVYLYEGKVFSYNDPGTKAEPQAKFNAAKPARSGRASNNVATYDNKKVSSYGYGAIAKDNEFLAEVHAMADRLGTSAQWIIDVMGHETDGTFSPSIPNNKGAVGLIQFYPGTPERLGTTSAKLAKMSRKEQLKYVEKYLTPYKADLGKGIEYVAAAVFGGDGLLTNLKKRGGVMIPGGELETYMNMVGRHAGRRYNTKAARKDRLVSSNTHTGYHPNCKVCQALLDDGHDIIAHESQSIA